MIVPAPAGDDFWLPARRRLDDIAEPIYHRNPDNGRNLSNNSHIADLICQLAAERWGENQGSAPHARCNTCQVYWAGPEPCWNCGGTQ